MPCYHFLLFMQKNLEFSQVVERMCFRKWISKKNCHSWSKPQRIFQAITDKTKPKSLCCKILKCYHSPFVWVYLWRGLPVTRRLFWQKMRSHLSLQHFVRNGKIFNVKMFHWIVSTFVFDFGKFWIISCLSDQALFVLCSNIIKEVDGNIFRCPMKSLSVWSYFSILTSWYQFGYINVGFSCYFKCPRCGHGATVVKVNPGMYTTSKINSQKPAGIPQGCSDSIEHLHSGEVLTPEMSILEWAESLFTLILVYWLKLQIWWKVGHLVHVQICICRHPNPCVSVWGWISPFVTWANIFQSYMNQWKSIVIYLWSFKKCILIFSVSLFQKCCIGCLSWR